MSFDTGTPGCGSCYSCGPDKRKDAVAEGWRQELLDRVNIYDCKTEKYIRTFVPSRARCSFPCDFADAFSDWTPVAGKEAESYPVLLEGLNRLVAAFPEDKRLSFFDCHNCKLSFPFLAFADDHHQSHPEVAVSFPGQVLDQNMKKPHWSMFSMVIEAKATAAQDPFLKNSLDSCSTVLQLAVNARGLMHAHGLLATFVLGFYGDTARIARFDHTCAVVTQSLSLKSVSDLKTLQRFLWRFVNPCEAVPFVGCDPTIRRLTSDDEVWLKSRLALVGIPPDALFITEARCAEVYDDDDDEDIATMAPKPYIMFKALDISGRLFSRATSVWLGIRDTRDKDDEEEVCLRVIKDAWRQLVHEPESTFYDRLDIIPDDERIGLAKLLDGGDLGEREVRLWETAVYGRPSSKDDIDHHSRLSSPRTTTSEEVLYKAPRSLFMSSRTTALPSHRPMQQTFSWRLSRGKDYWHRERSHMRFVIDTVGKPITRFDSTQELIQAVWDAIQGHRQAMQKAGVLHRDVSIGNILIVDKPHPSIKFRGFLHDFDYSAMDVDEPGQDSESASDVETDYGSECTEESEDTESSDDDSSDDSKSPAADLLPDLKKRTGTYYFMAVLLLERAGLIHEITHDLESFYWVLLWIVLRHTAHKHPLKKKAAAEIFKYGEDTAAVGAKMVWLRKDSSEKLVISNNKPLTRLLEKYRRLVHDSVITGQTPLTYEALEEIFVAALNSKEWPKNDKALDFSLPETRTRTVHLAQPKKKKNKKKVAKLSMGSKRKAQAEEDAAGNDAPIRRPRATGKRRRRG